MGITNSNEKMSAMQLMSLAQKSTPSDGNMWFVVLVLYFDSLAFGLHQSSRGGHFDQMKAASESWSVLKTSL